MVVRFVVVVLYFSGNRDPVTFMDLQPGKSESNMLIDYVKYSFSLPLKEYSLAPPGIMRGKLLFDIL